MNTIEEVDEVTLAVDRINLNNKYSNSRASSMASSTSTKAAVGSASANNIHANSSTSNLSNSNNVNLDDSFLDGAPACLRGHLLRSLLHTYPHSDAKYLDARFHCEKTRLARPIGLCLLADGNLVVSSTKDAKVCILSPTDLSELNQVTSSPRPFRRPSDLCALPDGRFAVRDDLGLQLFDSEGLFLQSVPVSALGSRSFGLATDNRGSLYTITTDNGNVVAPSVLGIDIDTGEVKTTIQLKDVVTDASRSRCRFLHHRGHRLYISDLGLNRVYVLDLARNNVRVFGGSGKERGLFQDVAGVAVDRKGWMLVADAGNHRIQLFDKRRKYIGMVKLMTPVKRPSAIVYDPDMEEPTIYVLNLNGDSLAKYELRK